MFDRLKYRPEPVPPELHRTYRWMGYIWLASVVCSLACGVYWLICYLFGFEIHLSTFFVFMVSLAIRRTALRVGEANIRRVEKRLADSHNDDEDLVSPSPSDVVG